MARNAMASAVAQIGDKQYCFGLQWEDIPQAKHRASIQSALDSHRAKFAAIRTIDASYLDENKLETDPYYQIGIAASKTGKGLYSAAAALTKIIDEIKSDFNYEIVVSKIESKTYWIFAYYEGKILTIGDTVATIDSLYDEILNIATVMSDELSIEPRVWVANDIPASVADRLQDELNAVVAGQSISDIFTDNHESISTLPKDTKVKARKGMTPTSIGLVVFAVAVVGTVFYYTHADTSTINKELQKSSRPIVNMISKKSAKQQQKEILESAYSEEVEWLKNDFTSQDARKLITGMVHTGMSYPQYLGGWSVDSFNWDITTPTEVNLELTKTFSGTPLTLQVALANEFKSIHLKQGGTAATLTLKLPDIKRDETIYDIIDYIKRWDYKDVQIAHDAQEMGVNWKLSNYDTSTRRKPIEGVKDKKLVTQAQLHTTASLLNLSGDTVTQLVMAELVLIRAKTTLVQQLIIDKKTNNWKLKGIVYEH